MPRTQYQLALFFWDDANGPISRGVPPAPGIGERGAGPRWGEIMSDADVRGRPRACARSCPALLLQHNATSSTL